MSRRKLKQRKDVKEEAVGAGLNKGAGFLQLEESLLLSGCTFTCSRRTNRKQDSEI